MKFGRDLMRMIWTALNGLAHPVTLVSLIGPFILMVNLNWIRVRLVTNHSPELAAAMEAPWVFALADYLIQTYTLVLAAVIFGISMVQGLVIRLRAKGEWRIEGDEPWTFAIVVCSLGALVIGVVGLTNGVFASPEVVRLYLPDGPVEWGRMRWPPMASPITMGRAVLVALGILLSIWIRKSVLVKSTATAVTAGGDK